MSSKFICYFLLSVFFTGCIGTPAGKNVPVSGNYDLVTDSGMVVSAHPESSAIGVDIMRRGGNAVDAAVATGFALAVCYPEAGNIGGGGFMVIRNADGRTDMIDYREKAPLRSFREMYLDEKGNTVKGLSTNTRLASGIPGSVDGMLNVHGKYGILPFREVIQPAIDLARNGFHVTREQAGDLNDYRESFLSRNRRIPSFVKATPWIEGDILKQPDLALTLERIRDMGREGFYSGKTARLIVSEMSADNGIITSEDLAGYKAVFRDPVAAAYRGYRIISASPPSSGGIILLQVLGMIEPYNLKDMGFNSWQYVHLITEAERRAFADRSEYLGDPQFTGVPSELLDQGYLRGRMSSYDQNAPTPSAQITPGVLQKAGSEETTHYSVVDRFGNAVAATTTLNGTFGNSIVVDSAGFLMNNEMDDFSVKPGTPNMYGLTGGEANSVAAGKRMLSSMTPAIVEKDGRLFLVAGSPGGSTIPTSVLQVIINVIDYGMGISDAVDAGRFHHQWQPDYIYYEKNSLDTAVLQKLSRMGHDLRERGSIGRVNAIMILPDGKRAAGADRRGSNAAAGY
ncbi:MAG: gamma-glutamyltransferase [Bacteroidales bacterium]